MTFTLFKLNFAGIGLPTVTFFLFICAFLFLSASDIFARTPQRGVWLSDEAAHQLSDGNKEALLTSLRRITGNEAIYFTEESEISLGPSCKLESGSTQAREILQWAEDSSHSFIIEDHSGSPSVNFGQIDQGLIYEDPRVGLRMLVWRIRLDFKDFDEMHASAEVRAAFDSGFTLLHELLHGLGYKDAALLEDIGDCEGLVNQVRSELRLPLRDQYFGEPYQPAQFTTVVRLRFRSKKEHLALAGAKASRDRVHYLVFLLPINYDALLRDHDELHLESMLKAKGKR
jgi:hypothetical protein